MNTTSPTARARAEFFGLRLLPFHRSRSASDFFLSPSRREALDFLADCRRGAGVALLSGEAGVGKTTVVRSLVATPKNRTSSVIITLPHDGALDFLREACKRFCLGVDAHADMDQLLRELKAELPKREASASVPLLIVDQAERLTRDSATSLLALVQAVSSGSLPLSIVLVSSPVHTHSAQEQEISLASCVTRRHAITTFDRDESAAYIRSQITAAGGNGEALFEAAALDGIHHHARGIPGEINAVCSLAMRLAHRAGERTVRLAHVQTVARKRARIQRSARKSDIMIGHPHSPRINDLAGRNHSAWRSVSLADIDSSGCSDAAGEIALQSTASVSLHASADFTAHRALAHDPTSRGEFSPHRLGEIGQGIDDLQHRAEVLDSKSERIAALLDTLDERIQRAEAATARSAEAELRLRTIATHVAEHTEALQERMSALLAMADSSQDAEENLRRLGASAEAVATAAYHHLNDAGAAWQKNLAQSGEQAAKLLADKSAALRAQMEQATLLIEERGPKFVRIAEHQIQDAIRELNGKLTPIRAEIQSLLAESNVVMTNNRTQFEAEHQRAQRSVEQMHSQTADRLIAVSTACQRAEVTCDNLQKAAAQSESSVARAEETAVELDRSRTEAKTTAAELAQNAAAARRAGDTLSSLSLAVDEKDQQLTSHQAVARSLISQLTDAAIAAADAAKVLDEKRASARADMDQCEVQLAKFRGELAAQLQAAENRAASDIEEHRSRLEGIFHTTEERTVTIAAALDQSSSSAAAERTRLENQVAAGITASSNLHRAVTVAMDARTQMQASAEEALRQSTRLQETCNETRAATAAATEMRTALADLEAQGTATIARLSDSQTAADKLRRELESTLANAAKEVRSTISEAGGASQSLEAAVQKAHQSATALEQMADASSRSAQSAVEKSRLSAADLDRAAQAAQAQSAELQSSRSALIDSHRGLVLDAETLLNRVAMRLEAVREVDGQLAEYDATAEDLRTHLTQLEEQLAVAATAVSQPQRILADAQAYASQLERVCDAAKKVKTSVSQAALAADERARDLTSAEQEAGQRLHQLRQDLSAAAQTLAQWVQEADRAQARLESTIQSCPPIAQTHAKEVLNALARTALQTSHMGKGTRRRDLQTIPSAGKMASEMIGASEPATREEEIAMLLAEARKARKDVNGAPRRPAPPEPRHEAVAAAVGNPALR